MMPQLLALESFDDAVAQEPSQNQHYQSGYDDGHAAGLQAAHEEIAALSEQFVQTLNDVDFTYAEARKQVFDSLIPLMTEVVEKVLPHCVTNGFSNQIVDLLIQTAAKQTGTAITLQVHPSQHAAVAEASQNIAAEVIVQSDPTLSEYAARIKNGDAEQILDMDTVLTAISEILGAVHHSEDRTNTHG